MIHVLYKAIVIVILSTFSTLQVIADDKNSDLELSKKSANYFAELYARTCILYAEDLMLLKERLDNAEVPELSRNKAKKFLENKPGTVWVIPNVFGDMLVSIDKKQNCAVYSRFLNINQVERAFIAKLEKTTAPIIHHKVQDETVQTKKGPKHIIRYVLTNEEFNTKRNHTLVTTTADNVEIQIKATMSKI